MLFPCVNTLSSFQVFDKSPLENVGGQMSLILRKRASVVLRQAAAAIQKHSLTSF